jgi:peptidoglycan/LPS O-acetylase OafA/YrhL
VSEVSVALPEPEPRSGPLVAEGRHAAPDALAPPPRHPRFPLIDGMRAIAVLAVVLVHTASSGGAISGSVMGRVLAHMNIGVAVFFVISGFLLYRPFIAYRTGGAAAPGTRDYFKRRVLRIYPAYWLALVVFALLPGITAAFAGHWWPMAALVHTLPVYSGSACTHAGHVCGLVDTWSLVVELSFYAVLPIYAFVMTRVIRQSRVRVRTWMAAELAVLVVLSTASTVLQFVVLDPVPRWISATVGSYVFWFALGMALAMASVALQRAGSRPWPLRLLARRPEVAWLLAAAIYALLCVWLPATPLLFARGQVCAAYLGFGVIAALLLAPAVLAEDSDGLPRRVLANRVLAWLGLVSYGIFLWHGQIAVKLGAGGAKEPFGLVLAGTLALATLCAAASYYLVERPVLRLKYKRLRDARLLRRPA